MIKNTILITDVLDRYAGVTITGAKTTRKSFNISCPYHHDRNPSFTVYTETNTFFCWSGCCNGRSGDVIDVVKLSRKVDTKEAIKILIYDYELKRPGNKQAKEWQKKRANRRQTAALQKQLNQKLISSIDTLKRIESKAKLGLSSIKTIEDMEQTGELYHVTTLVNYWLDCLMEHDPVLQFQTLQEVDSFFVKLKMKTE
ncbi:CHC2 zinc finger domain-containing protein [Priestia megaterium]|uniref:CHC2 zinc finger domain-containing protein n=1 Tax=Priestia megaterium TaxID=1404 RepID=UPI0026E2F148|nr:CHC2 zinc finger domain-containing protein [Priestia megaterium]MDO6848751.1 CHC2 zinc finger domain-containing protein [Priestia megaterium]